ncbi:chemotaxis protein CheA [Anaerosacchariphilus polymeriproducens]|uniref:Chemotaxis protein CheA n=1 Tax=Anaerosacchariphilus polymeriproducens TaxID=1812858 RepID=A0A371AVS0_9FIRM|nr:chemotaxis protein CheA [Anaerosacchariphilus polymeriproducens]RDU23684.1 chemotaxis protein CheA [Anaerosacchariphilus polymeriproducens]
MLDQYINEPMLEMFIFETEQLIVQLEQIILSSEKGSCFTPTAINDIFRIMHTIKGSSAMMMFNNISTLSHSMEDVFYYLREDKPEHVDCTGLSDLVLESIDFIKVEIEKIKYGKQTDGDSSMLTDLLKDFLSALMKENNSNTFEYKVGLEEKKQQYYIMQEKVITTVYKNKYKAVIYFEEGCEMENIHAYTIIRNLKEITEEYYFLPEDIIDNDESIEVIRKEGFQIFINSDYSYQKMHDFLMQTIFLKELELTQLENDDEFKRFKKKTDQPVIQDNKIKGPDLNNHQTEEEHDAEKYNYSSASTQSIISVSVSKLDKLMDLVGEMVIAEAMVIQNPDLQGLELDNFQKAARQLNKITSEMQDMVMSIRMVPLSATFQKMHRIVRDMCKKLGKEVELNIIGEETEVDKNIIEHISDPLMHLVRNSIDHGIESSEERVAKGKSAVGTITLEAKNAGSEVLVIVKDNGRGLDKSKIYQKAKEKGLVYKNEDEMSDKEIFNLILLPGFSTNDIVSEFSGRGVGMDVVLKNIETVGGSLLVDSILDIGTTITLKISLTLAIIDGMNIKVGNSFYTIPTIAIKESFRPKPREIITDPDGNEMIMVRGKCYPILRLHEHYKIKTKVTNFIDGIIIMVEQEDKTLCIFADELLGQQQVVVKALPVYIQRFRKVKGLAGCTLLGDGSISLILDVAELVNLRA